jgi:hypothetical protein
MEGSTEVDLAGHAALEALSATRCQLILTTEDPPFAPDPHPPKIELTMVAPRISFARPSAVLLRVWTEADPALQQARHGALRHDAHHGGDQSE